MDAWVALGIFLLGTGVGALLTTISFLGKTKKLKAQIRDIEHCVAEQHHHAA